jgi:glutamine amidotransferase-like uncharacterized protein
MRAAQKRFWRRWPDSSGIEGGRHAGQRTDAMSIMKSKFFHSRECAPGRPSSQPTSGEGSSRRFSRRQILFQVAPLGALALVAACGTTATSAEGDGASGRPLALIYRGPAACRGCAEVVAALLASAPSRFRTLYCGPDERLSISTDTLANATLYVQPGGGDNLDAAWRAMHPYANTIRDWVHGGGHYAGFCMGGFLAGFDPGMGLLPGDSGEYVNSPGAAVHTNGDALVNVHWGGTERGIYFQGGPYFSLPKHADAQVLATYSNGLVAAMVAPFGSGSVGVTGPHPEAPASWYREADLPVPHPMPFDLGYDLVETTIRT